MIEKKLQNVLNALERHYPYESESGIIKLSLGDFAEAVQTLNSIILKNQCARSHPHEDMNELCELKTEIARLNNKLAQAKQEPVAWVGINEKWGMAKMVASEYKKDGYKPVYLDPPQREWQGLTDHEIELAVMTTAYTFKPDDIARAIEAKLREKNAPPTTPDSANRSADSAAAFCNEEILNLVSLGGKLALELECLLMDTKDLAVVSKWWDTGNEALKAWHDYLWEVRNN